MYRLIRTALSALIMCLILCGCGEKTDSMQISAEAATDPGYEEESSDENTTESERAQAQDIYDHIMSEDWQYLYDQMDHPENFLIEPEDLKAIFKSNAVTDEITAGKLTMGEQNYALGQCIGAEDEDGTRIVKLNILHADDPDTVRFIITFVPTGTGNKDYILKADFNGMNRYEASPYGFGGAFLVVPKDYTNVTIRGITLKDKWIDNRVLESEAADDERSDYQNGSYKCYRVYVPWMYDDDYDKTIENADLAMSEYGYDLGKPSSLAVTAVNGFGDTVTSVGIRTEILTNCNTFRSANVYVPYIKDDDGYQTYCLFEAEGEDSGIAQCITQGICDNIEWFVEEINNNGLSNRDDFRKLLPDEADEETFDAFMSQMEDRIYNRITMDQPKINELYVKTDGPVRLNSDGTYLVNLCVGCKFVNTAWAKWNDDKERYSANLAKEVKIQISDDQQVTVMGESNRESVYTQLFNNLLHDFDF